MRKGIKKERKLREYQRFNIVVKNTYVVFNDTKGERLSDWSAKLTPSQWRKASKYLTRKLIPFCGYEYKIKEQYNKLEAIYKII